MPIAEKFMKKVRFFNNMGGIWSSESEVDYHRLANLPEVSVICDIEFNAGHCPITFLQAN